MLVATSTLAWGVNTPAHLVIIKGTEFFDAPTRFARTPLRANPYYEGRVVTGWRAQTSPRGIRIRLPARNTYSHYFRVF